MPSRPNRRKKQADPKPIDIPNDDRSILVVDIGNTSTSLGLFRRGTVRRVHRIEKVAQHPGSVRSILRKTAGREIDGICIASVVPALNRTWIGAAKTEFGIAPLMLTHKLQLGIPVTYPRPESVGADRLANAVGGSRKYGFPLIIADFGTAVTFDIVTQQDGYIGGVIAPGLPLMFDYLAERTAQLPKISWRPVRHRIGKSTAQAMRLGAQWGYRGIVREILGELQKIPELRHAAICATGGFAGQVFKGVEPQPVVDSTLTLYGIGCVYQLNR